MKGAVCRGVRDTCSLLALKPPLGTTSNYMDAAIEPLPDVTRSKLRSTQILTSLSQIVSELLQNSLDAGARQIDIGVDCEEWNCWVRDDGSGMSKDGMDILGTGLEAGRYGACG